MTIDLASRLYDKGVLCVPAKDRKPVVPYSHWNDEPPAKDEYLLMWGNYLHLESHILCGSIAAIDVDVKNDTSGSIVSSFEGDLKEFCPDVFARLYIEQTPSGGRHYFFHTEVIFQSENLAFADASTLEDILDGKTAWRPIIEYRGYHGLCRCFPSPGLSVIQGDILSAPMLQEHEVNLIRYLAQEYNSKPEETVTDEPRVERVVSDTPGNDYSSRVPLSDVCDLLNRHGWQYKQRGSRIYLRRPDARTKNWDADIKGRVFKCYSGSVSEFIPGEAYSLWRVYAILEHRGDYKAAAKALSAMGYGSSTTVTVRQYQENIPDQHGEDEQMSEEDILWNIMQGNRVKISEPPKDVEFILHWIEKKKMLENQFNVAAAGMIMVISGPPKTRKSSIISSIVASSIVGAARCGFTLKLDTDDEIVVLDTEQPDKYSYEYARRICIQGGVRELPDNITIYKQRSMSVMDRRKSLSLISRRHKKLRVLVIDGIKDMLRDYVGDNKEADSLVSEMMYISSGLDRNVLVIVVLHLNKGDGKLRGAIGTELENKADVRVECHLVDDSDESTHVKFPITRDRKPPAFVFDVIGPNIPVVEGWPKVDYDFSIGDQKPPTTNDHNFPDVEPAAMPSPRVEYDHDLYIPSELLGLTEEELQ